MGLGAELGFSLANKAMDFGFNSLQNFQSGIWDRDNKAFLQEFQKNQNLDYITKSPQAYVSGLQQAGLNPMLAYGSPSQPMSSSSASNGSTMSPNDGNTGKQLLSLIKFIKAIRNLK